MEYSGQASALELIEAISSIVAANSLSVDGTLYVVAVRLLVLREEVVRRPDFGLDRPEALHSFRRARVREEIQAWHSPDQLLLDLPHYESVYGIVQSDCQEDFLGLLYQSLSRVGLRNNRGAYYTPTAVVEAALRNNPFSGQRFFDHCCGTGNFLLGAARVLGLTPVQLYGVDNDQLAIHIARLNVLLAYPDYDALLNIWCQDALKDLANGEVFCQTNHLLGHVDYIATNPPWGTLRNVPKLVDLTPDSTSEAFSLFLYKAMSLLREGGRLSFILPEAFMYIKAHRGIREFVLHHAKIERIVSLGRVFTGVLSGTIRLDLIKGTAQKDWAVSVCSLSGDTDLIPQARFLDNPDSQLDIDLRGDEAVVLRKLYAVDHTTLAGQAEWALGVVTGDNERFLSKVHQSGMEPIFKGSEVGRYRLQAPSSYVLYEPVLFQQVARNDLYRAPEKLIYRFISSRLVFAFDNKRCLTLNSANVLVPAIPGFTVKVALAFLNSSVFQFIFRKRCATNKVLRGDLEGLPFPVLSKEYCTRLEVLVDCICAGEDREHEVDHLVFKCFSLTDIEIGIIMQSLKGENGTA